MRGVPAPRPPHLVGGEVEGVDLGLGQVVAAGDVALVPGPGEPRRRVDQLLLPGPVEDGAEVLAGLVGRAARVLSLILDGLFVDPVEELADVLAPQLLDGDAAAPPLPLPEGREVLVARRAGQGLGAQVALRRRLEGRRHLIGPGAAQSLPRGPTGPRGPSPNLLVGFWNNKSNGVCPGRSRNPSQEGCESDAFADCGESHAGPGSRLRCRRTDARQVVLLWRMDEERSPVGQTVLSGRAIPNDLPTFQELLRALLQHLEDLERQLDEFVMRTEDPEHTEAWLRENHLTLKGLLFGTRCQLALPWASIGRPVLIPGMRLHVALPGRSISSPSLASFRNVTLE